MAATSSSIAILTETPTGADYRGFRVRPEVLAGVGKSAGSAWNGWLDSRSRLLRDSLVDRALDSNDMTEATRALRIENIAPALPGPYELADPGGRCGCAGGFHFLADPVFPDPQAVADHPGAGRLLLEDRHGDVLSPEALPGTEIDGAAARREAEGMLVFDQTRQSLRA
jgi:hypothetical protein